MPLYFQILASGSKGNSILICSAATRVLLDAGLSGKELARRMDMGDVPARRLDALVISHEHQDHVRGMGVMSRRFDLPVYLSQGTLEKLPPQVGHIAHPQVFHPGVAFTIGDLQIRPFAISHDAAEPSGFIIQHGETRLGICTDLGIATHLVKTRLQKCHGLILEANHDTDMLLKGPYPLHLKQRIRSRHGHLSNEDTCELLRSVYHEALKVVVFAHLSEVNNHPHLVSQGFHQLCRVCEWDGLRCEIGNQHQVTPAVELK
ncbi:MBL fold metallo-hydrolase [Desulfoferrobacter suflitae]|uniref:MBL fold metallo-hydrolase n=1 Tax=Desulfoferrobacter suflitae TaxID=2865782 RepID=UPI002164A730|nr:MBL fold metallo-hydrolase [Desulfoferrobacter suflitae]MCK8602357.1 MBL fold metallo-hydrolase [Desulfoferrobacter suflitae]